MWKKKTWISKYVSSSYNPHYLSVYLGFHSCVGSSIWKTSLQCWNFERIFFCFKYHKIQISRFTKRIIFSPTKIQEYFSIKLKGPFQSRKYWWFCFSPLLKSHTVASALFLETVCSRSTQWVIWNQKVQKIFNLITTKVGWFDPTLGWTLYWI